MIFITLLLKLEMKKITDENENDYFNFEDFITPNLCIGRKKDQEILQQSKMRSQKNHFKFFLLKK